MKHPLQTKQEFWRHVAPVTTGLQGVAFGVNRKTDSRGSRFRKLTEHHVKKMVQCNEKRPTDEVNVEVEKSVSTTNTGDCLKGRLITFEKARKIAVTTNLVNKKGRCAISAVRELNYLCGTLAMVRGIRSSD